MQLSLLPALEAERPRTKPEAPSHRQDSPLPAVSRPTSAQINYLKRLTGIRADGQLQRYVARKIGKPGMSQGKLVLTKQDFAQAIDRELNEKRWAA
ncbi:hypothetical protein [Aquidulcibacter sp.]|uniref:hypothetical protein n=1 Tax=Aquidulcibacter sp. TaxID=2052990 RepID=UPI0025C036D8|nr:hypothetical protein [Aquidulcibacter sp.]MCA3697091.1 hypothetical protein [Aquidulcibacter sp.]